MLRLEGQAEWLFGADRVWRLGGEECGRELEALGVVPESPADIDAWPETGMTRGEDEIGEPQFGRVLDEDDDLDGIIRRLVGVVPHLREGGDGQQREREPMTWIHRGHEWSG